MKEKFPWRYGIPNVCRTPFGQFENSVPEWARRWREAMDVQPMATEVLAQYARCPLLPWSLALGTAPAPFHLPPQRISQTPSGLDDPETSQCRNSYEEYFATFTPLVRNALDECVRIMDAGGVEPLRIPDSACTNELRTELLTQSFLSRATVAEDLGPDEIGDDYAVLMQ